MYLRIPLTSFVFGQEVPINIRNSLRGMRLLVECAR